MDGDIDWQAVFRALHGGALPGAEAEHAEHTEHDHSEYASHAPHIGSVELGTSAGAPARLPLVPPDEAPGLQHHAASDPRSWIAHVLELVEQVGGAELGVRAGPEAPASPRANHIASAYTALFAPAAAPPTISAPAGAFPTVPGPSRGAAPAPALTGLAPPRAALNDMTDEEFFSRFSQAYRAESLAGTTSPLAESASAPASAGPGPATAAAWPAGLGGASAGGAGGAGAAWGAPPHAPGLPRAHSSVELPRGREAQRGPGLGRGKRASTGSAGSGPVAAPWADDTPALPPDLTSTWPSPLSTPLGATPLLPAESALDPDDAEDKRTRNTQASARFRAKKKQHVEGVQRAVRDLERQHGALQIEVDDLRRENGLLRDMVQLKYGGT